MYKILYPHITFILAASLIVLTIRDSFNPLIGFLRNNSSRVIIYVLGGLNIINAVLAYITQYNKSKRRENKNN